MPEKLPESDDPLGLLSDPVDLQQLAAEGAQQKERLARQAWAEGLAAAGPAEAKRRMEAKIKELNP